MKQVNGRVSVLVAVLIGIGAGAMLTNLSRTPAVAQDTKASSPAFVPDQPASTLKVVGGTPEEVGRYLIRVGGCNDCHTPGHMMVGERVPESEWLTGVPVGWRGPWGTTYASNLRLFVQDFDETTFVDVMRKRNTRPPMIWTAMHALSDDDLRAVFQYIKSLGPKGEKMPAYVPPGVEPKGPYLSMELQGLPKVPGLPQAK